MAQLSEFARSVSTTSLESLLSPPAAIEPMQKFLRFRLDLTQSMLIAVEEIAAVQTVALFDILPVPQMSASVLGLSNWRGEALWLIDLSQQLGLSAIAQQIQPSSTLIAIIVQSGHKSLGLIVPEIYEIEEQNPDTLLQPSPDLFSPQIAPFIKGYFRHDRGIVLNAAAVLRDPSLQIHS